MDLFKLESKIIFKHILVWLILETILQILSPLPGSIPIRIISGLIILMNTIFTFYFLGLYILPKYWGNYLFLPGGILISLSLYCSLYYVIGYHILPVLGSGSNKAKGSLTEFLDNTIFLYLIIATCASAFFLNRRSIYFLKKNSKKEKELISKELNLLKGQFNNHLTFNFLNFCYSNIYKSSVTAAESIDLFSDMLRDTLASPSEGKIPLQKEIIYIKNYIQLQKIISTNNKICFNFNGEFKNKFIIPRLLISFMDENLTQQDLSNNGKSIEIDLIVNQKHMIFKVAFSTNYNRTNFSNNESTTRKILDLFYNKKYKVEEECLSTQFINKLTLYW
jgi:sensor histidine kinase YesM